VSVLVGREDPALSARIVARHALHYRPVPSEPGFPSFVRAGSSLSWFLGKLAVVQDDTRALGLIDPVTFEVDAVALPLREDGARTFDKERGNKRDKPDLEASFSATYQGAPALYALGSGSHENRESIALLVSAGGALRSHFVHVPAFYAALRAQTGFLSSELNLEGAVLIGDTLRLFQRSNGALLAGHGEASCATCDVSLGELEAYLHDPTHAALPALGNVQRYDLGRLGEARLTFTDVALRSDGALLFSASAESSPNAYDDGAVAGSAVGVLTPDGARYALLRDQQGAPSLDKAEGIALRPERPDHALLVFDPDDHHEPACLAELALRGF
jgi:hypothetical protein